MQMTAKEVGETLVVTVMDRRIDAAVAVRFKDKMQELTVQSAERVVLDLSQVEFLDSSGLGAVVGSMKQLGRQRKLDLAALTPTVDKVFRITRMDRVFRIFATVDAALEESDRTGRGVEQCGRTRLPGSRIRDGSIADPATAARADGRDQGLRKADAAGPCANWQSPDDRVSPTRCNARGWLRLVLDSRDRARSGV